MKLLPLDILLAELARRSESQRNAKSKEQSFLNGLHPKQLAFVRDKSRRKVALCSRRAGKSYAIAAWLLEGGFSDPGGLSLYVARSKNNARLILLPALEDLDRKYQLGLWFREIDNQLMVQLPNGHRIWLAGAKDRSEIGKFRGAKYRRVAVDEAQEYGAFLEEMVRDALEPALIDKAGELCLAGTPSPIPAGLFYTASTGDGGIKWAAHHWTLLDNPYIPNAASEVERILRDNGWTRTHPTFRREYLGEWVRDEGALVYAYSAGVNSYTELPEGEYVYALGVDVGFTDSTAIVVAANRVGHPEIYIIETWKREGLIPSAVAAHVQRFITQYNPQRVVVDEGGAGKGYAEEMRQRYSIPCEAAEKTKKRAFQEIVGGDLKSGVVKIDPWKCGPLLDEIQILQWLPDKSAEDERFENHAADAFLYVVRALRAWYRPQIEPPKPGSQEALAAEQKRHKEEARRRVRRESQKRWGQTRRWKLVHRTLDQCAGAMAHIGKWLILAHAGFGRTQAA